MSAEDRMREIVMSRLKFPKIVGYTIIEEIGGGGYARVYRATHIEQRRVAACKVVFYTDSTTADDRKMLEREVRIHSALSHANVIGFINAAVVDENRRSPYMPGVYMLLELAAGGDLFDKIAPDVGVSEDVAHMYFSQLAAGVDYIHNQGVVHRDLKPENILLDAAGHLKISDFGLGSVWKLMETGKTRMLTDVCGSLPYIAPELSAGTPYHAPPIDVWGIGVILFTLLVGNTPWDEPTERSPEYKRYLTQDIFHDNPWTKLSGPQLAFLTDLLEVDPSARLTMSDVLAHSWVSRPSQLARAGALSIAAQLSQGLRDAGDLDVANPSSFSSEGDTTIMPDRTIRADGGVDADGDVPMPTAPMLLSQFTQSLILFSQTQTGAAPRHNPHLTRFWARPAPATMLSILDGALRSLGCKTRSAAAAGDASADASAVSDGANERDMVKLRVGGMDKRKVIFKGWVEVEPFEKSGMSGSLVVFRRDVGNPISWRQLWRAAVEHKEVNAHVYRRK